MFRSCIQLLLFAAIVGASDTLPYDPANELSNQLMTPSTVCKTVPGLTRMQQELCLRQSDVTAAALQGLQLAVDECQHQFRWHRWNCSSLTTKNKNPHTSPLFKRGYRETAFAHAIAAAGVAYSVGRACSQGRLLSCGCDPVANRDGGKQPPRAPKGAAVMWQWGGCSHNLHYGMEFSRQFLDSREKGSDIQTRINLHNNEAGRLAVANNMEVRCKCHGMSGSCEMRTCWRAPPDFRKVGKVLKNRFRKAVMVDQSNVGNGSSMLVIKKNRERKQRQRLRNKMKNSVDYIQKKKKKKRGLDTELLYYQKSPNFCERDPTADVAGTHGRLCNRTSDGNDGCDAMCCGRGYNLVMKRTIERCNCKFHWCCKVECQNCTVEQWISVCK